MKEKSAAESISEQKQSLADLTVWHRISLDQHFWFFWRFLAFEALVQKLGIHLEGKQILEVGSGTGVVARQIRAGFGVDVITSDIDEHLFSEVDAEKRPQIFYDIFSRDPKYQNAFDIIILFDVLEHVADEKNFLEALAFHLKPGGLLFVNVPAMPTLFSLYDKVVGHLRRYTAGSLGAVMKSAEFAPIRLGYWGLSLVPIVLMRKAFLGLKAEKNLDAEAVIKQGFEVPRAFLNVFFRRLGRLEVTLLPRTFIGSSVMGVFKKP